jgi:hypothetical protein
MDIFGHVAEALRALTEMLNNVANLVRSGDKGWEYLAARRMRARLVNICARSTWTVSGQSTLDLYLLENDPTHAHWSAVTQELEHVLHDVNAVLDDLRNEHSDFVLDSAYEKLVSVLRRESVVLATLAHQPQPETQEAQATVRRLNNAYKLFQQQYHAAVGELGKYLKSHPAQAESEPSEK